MPAARASCSQGVDPGAWTQIEGGCDWSARLSNPAGRDPQEQGADVVLRGEPDQTLPQLANTSWEMVPGCCWRDAQGRYRIGAGLA